MQSTGRIAPTLQNTPPDEGGGVMKNQSDITHMGKDILGNMVEEDIN